MDLLNSRDGKYIAVILCMGALLWGAGQRILTLEARPVILEAKVDDRTEDVRRGPVKITRRTVVAPDGTKTTEQTREVAAEERRIEISSSSTRQETPPTRSRTRYVGVGVDPLDYARLPRLRAGLTLWSVLDAGLAYDPRRSLTRGAVQLELAYRF